MSEADEVEKEVEVMELSSSSPSCRRTDEIEFDDEAKFWNEEATDDDDDDGDLAVAAMMKGEVVVHRRPNRARRVAADSDESGDRTSFKFDTLFTDSRSFESRVASVRNC